MKLTFYGHACFLVEVSGSKILFDPFISPNENASHINVNDIECDYMFLSHAHGDHIADAITIAQNCKPDIVANYELATWLQGKDVSNVHPMNQGGNKSFNFGSVKVTPAIHSSSFDDGSYGGNPCGFLITSNEANFYYSGDTALDMNMQLIPRNTKLDFSILCIGDTFTMGVDDAIIAADFVQCNKVVGMHFNTFPPIKINTEDAKVKFRNAGKELILLDIGETRDI